MKRVLSLALIAVLAIGMGMSGFASLLYDADLENIKDFAGTYTLADGVRNYTVRNDVVDMGTVRPLDEPKLYIDLRTNLFGNNTDSSVTTASAFNLARLITDLKVNTANITSFAELNAALTDNNMKLETIIAAMEADLDDPDDELDGKEVAAALLKAYGAYITTADVTDEDAIFILDEIDVDNVDFATGAKFVNAKTTNVANRNLTANEIRKSKIKIGTTVRAGSQLIKDLSLVAKDGQIVLKLQDEFVSTKAADVEVFIYLNIDGKRLDNKGITVLAELENPVTEVYASHDYVNLSDGYVAEAIEFNSKVAVYLGNGVTIHTKFFKDKKYYGIATRDNDQEAERVMTQYKEIDNVLTLKTVGLNSVGDYVTLSTDYSDYYVYDKDMNYLGRGNEELSYSSKLYLAYNRIEVEEDEEEEVEVEAPLPTTPENPETGGDGNASNNVNLNPGTGR